MDTKLLKGVLKVQNDELHKPMGGALPEEEDGAVDDLGQTWKNDAFGKPDPVIDPRPAQVVNEPDFDHALLLLGDYPDP
jgi:hypothetical protein